MKIITWNVNGIRAVLNKNALAWAFDSNPDAICLQEVKAKPEQLSENQKASLKLDYVWNPAQKLGYSGVTTFYKNKPDTFSMGMGKRKFDMEGRLIATGWADVRLLNIYFPSGSRGHERVDFKLEFYAELLKVCKRLHKNNEQLILCGDFNTAHNEIDLKNAKQNKNTSGFLPIEREWFQKYLDAGFVDVFRHLYPDKVQYTWWTNILNARARGIGWRLDYFLISESLLPRVRDVIIHDSVMGSDHCPVELILDENASA
ncbi:MAG: exodeoxyribonuclease III [Anaerolineales bacterium]|nr:exodeoxyribonuclease III [Anaerolineales bacterium]